MLPPRDNYFIEISTAVMMKGLDVHSKCYLKMIKCTLLFTVMVEFSSLQVPRPSSSVCVLERGLPTHTTSDS